MGILNQERIKLEELCLQFRKDVLKVLHDIQTGHPGGSLSVCEILTSIYFHCANIFPENINSKDRDRIILCKGHAAPMLYRVLAEKGFFPKEEMASLRQINSRLQGHPSSHKTPGVELSTGPLGLGISAGLGMALAQKLDGCGAYTYAVLGDGELDEGIVWEAVMSAVKFKADNLIMIIDWNGVQLDGTNDQIMPLGDLARKFNAFGLNVIECDGHNVESLVDSIDTAKSVAGKPSVILAHTVKGKGVSFMEGKNEWHGKAIDDAHYEQAIAELEGRHNG